MNEEPQASAFVIYDDPSTERSALRVVGDTVSIELPEGNQPLPAGALEAVFRRLGGELEGEPLKPSRLALPNGQSLLTFEFLARYDVMPRIWAALEAPGQPPRALLAVTLGAALRHLARAASQS